MYAPPSKKTQTYPQRCGVCVSASYLMQRKTPLLVFNNYTTLYIICQQLKNPAGFDLSKFYILFIYYTYIYINLFLDLIKVLC